jgi:hypothetical protein
MTNTNPTSTVLNFVTTELTNVRASIVKLVAKILGLGNVVVSKVEEVEATVVADVKEVVEDVFDSNVSVS